jgi:hypothetical protein
MGMDCTQLIQGQMAMAWTGDVQHPISDGYPAQ